MQLYTPLILLSLCSYLQPNTINTEDLLYSLGRNSGSVCGPTVYSALGQIGAGERLVSRFLYSVLNCFLYQAKDIFREKKKKNKTNWLERQPNDTGLRLPDKGLFYALCSIYKARPEG